MDTLASLVVQLGKKYLIFVPMVSSDEYVPAGYEYIPPLDANMMLRLNT
jgi:hypothetical protein